MTATRSADRFRPEDLSRLETLSDGIFAIAMTLLVLEIRVPDDREVAAAGGLLAALAMHWPSYVAFLLSFTLISSYWVNHHALFRLITRTDHRFTLLTLLLLATICFLPFPTAVLGHHLLDAGRHIQRDAVTVYAAGLLVAAVAWTIGWHYAGRLADPALDRAFLASVTRRALISIALHVVAVIAAWFWPMIGLVAATGLALLYLTPPPHPVLANGVGGDD